MVEARKVGGKTFVHFTFGSPVLPGQCSFLVPDTIADAALQVHAYLLQQDDRVPGFEVVLRKTGSHQMGH
jgi:hypothetical protein